eukprot:ANDGO_07367.mRNA.1 Acylamino-acid-releasing enzyme
MSKVEKLYSAILDIPTLGACRIVNSDYAHVQYATRDFEGNKKPGFSLMVSASGAVIQAPARNPDGLVTSLTSNSGKWHVRVYETSFEVFDSHTSTIFRFDVSPVFSKVYGDDWFSSFDFDAAEKRLLFVGNKKPESTKTETDYVFQEEWGEQVAGFTVGVAGYLDLEFAYTVDIADGTTHPPESEKEEKKEPKVLGGGTIAPPPEWNCSIAQAKWAPPESEASGSSILICTCIPHAPRKFGTKFCFQRKSFLACFDIGKQKWWRVLFEHSEFSTTWNARSPLFVLNGKSLLFSSTESCKYSHNTSCALWSAEWNSSVVFSDGANIVLRVLRRILSIDSDASTKNFWSHYFAAKRCVFGSRFFFDSPHGMTPRIMSVDLESLDVQQERDGASLLDVCPTSGCLLFQESTPAQPPSVLQRTFRTGAEARVFSLADSKRYKDLLSPITFSLLTISPSQEPQLPFECLLLRAPLAAGTVRRLMAIPHGGPHSAFSLEFVGTHAFFALLGYDVLLINYRGSCNYGQDFNDVLLGRIGELDVQDCVDAISHVCKDDGVYDKNVVLCGGSHGGFAVLHLAYHLPKMVPRLSVSLVVGRNPVVNVVSMIGSTDIPDWCTGEIGLPYDFSNRFSFEEMWKVSPIRNFPEIDRKTRFVFLVGNQDKRVPPSQSVEAYHNLRELGFANVDMLFFSDSDHSLSKPTAEKFGWLFVAKLLAPPSV